MNVAKFFRQFACLVALTLMGIVFGLLADNTQADNWFDVNGASTSPTAYGVVAGSTYSWDDPNWATAVGGATATGNWVQGSFARFLGGTGTGGVGGANYTITVSGDEQNAGIFNAVSNQALTINASG